MDETEHVGQADFSIRTGDEIHHYYTRRNFSMDSCWEWIEEWSQVIRGESVVCISGDFSSHENENLNGSYIKHLYWQIDRMKSNHSEWSYFYRGPGSGFGPDSEL
jgi:hypothetical protein